MNSKSNRNEGVRIIAAFDDRVIPLAQTASRGGPCVASRSTNEGIQLLAAFQEQAQSLNGVDEPITAFIARLKQTIVQLQQTNAQLSAHLASQDLLIQRHLCGPEEDEI
jgi:hypothetical protein